MKSLLLLLLLLNLGIRAGNSDKEKTALKTISGRITDAQGEALPAARIHVVETGETFFADMDGKFEIRVKCDKPYLLSVHTPGFEPLELRTDHLTRFQELSLNSL